MVTTRRRSAERSAFRQWFDTLALLGVGVAIVVVTVVLPNKARTAALKGERDGLQAEVEALQADVDLLAAEIEALQGDPYMVERRLRDQLHYLRPGEQVLVEREQLPTPTREVATPPEGLAAPQR